MVYISRRTRDKVLNGSHSDMFYTTCLTDKRSPLRLFWIAAHWDKKISKSQIYEADIRAIVDNICRSKVSINLKISGHLLYGVVRVFSRKVKYLLTECSEALSVAKFSLTGKGPIELVVPAKDKKKVTIKQTFGMLEKEFDFDFLAGTNIVADIDLTANQCRKEDITLIEPECSMISPFPMDDDFGLGDVGDFFMDFRNLPNILEEFNADQVLPNVAKRSFDDIIYLPETQIIENQDDKGSEKQMKMSDNVPIIQTACLQKLELLEELDEGMELMLKKKVDEGPEAKHAKRKLVVDSTTVISKGSMRHHMDDVDTILLAGVALAPPTKKLMLVHDQSKVPKICQIPSCHFINPVLIKMLSKSMTADSKNGDKEPKLDIEMPRGGAQAEEYIPEISEDCIDFEESPVPIKDLNTGILDHLEAGFGKPWNNKPEAIEKYKKNKRSETINILVESKENISSLPQSTYPKPPAQCCRFNMFDPFSPAENIVIIPRREFSPKAPTTSGPSIGLKGRFAVFLRNAICSSGSTTLNAALDNLKAENRREAAALFYSTLELKKGECITVRQVTPFSSIEITRGPKFKNLSSFYAL